MANPSAYERGSDMKVLWAHILNTPPILLSSATGPRRKSVEGIDTRLAKFLAAWRAMV